MTNESDLVPLHMHNLLTVGPAPWTDTRVPAEAFNVARAVYGTSSEDDDKRVYRTVQAALWKVGIQSTTAVAAPQPEAADNCEISDKARIAMLEALIADREKSLRKLRDAAPQPEATPQWQPIETAPKDGRKMLLTYTNSNGMRRIVVGGWVTDEEAAETDTDDVGLEAGWYERIDNWDDYSQVSIHQGEPTHWMPLPAAPSAQAEPTACPHTGQCHPGFCPCSDAKRQAEQKGGE